MRRPETMTKSADDRLDDALDAALEMTFPASDPIAVYVAEPQREAWDDSNGYAGSRPQAVAA